MSAPRYYAVTRSINPATGQPRLRDGAWLRGSPMAEVVVNVLRTPKGSFKPDPSFGVDYSDIEKGSADAPSKLIAAIEAALARYVRDNLLANLNVSAERAGQVIRYEVSFDDPNVSVGRRTTLKGAL